MTADTLTRYRGFLDDAAMFPPGLAPLDMAIQTHLQRRSAPSADLVGPLLLASDQLSRAHAQAIEIAHREGINLRNTPLQVGIVIPAGGLDSALRATGAVPPEVQVSGLELKTNPTDWQRDVEQFQQISPEAARYVELTSRQVADGALAVLKGGPVKLKFRAGGLEASLFPTPAELAEVIVEAVRHDVPFKLTAGLHQAVRHTGPTGFTHHGFLNIAVATALAQKGYHSADVIPVLEERNGGKLAAQYLQLDSQWRVHFESFGTCSITEPLESLVDLNLIPSTLLQGS